MANSIRGLTVEISADASSFNKEMSQMRKAAQQSQTELNALQKSLELKFDGEKFSRAQKVAQQAIDQTAANAEALRRRLEYLEKTGNVDTTGYGKLQAELAKTELQGQRLQQQLEKINAIRFTALGNEVQKVGNGITSAGKALAPFSTLAAGAVVGLGKMGLDAVATADNVATLATQYGTTAEAIQRFDYVALQTDVASENLYKALVKVRAGVADIGMGTTSTATAALQALNLNFAAFDGSEEQFYAIVDALAAIGDKTQLVSLANDIFGEELANKILPLIEAGTEAINEYRTEFDELGAMTNEQVAALAEFDNVMNKIKTQLKNVAGQIGASLLPLMQSIANVSETRLVPKLQRLAEWFNSLCLSQQEFALKALLVGASFAPLALGIGKVVTAVGGIIKAIPQLMSGLSALAAHPIILIIAAVVALLVLLYTKCEAFREAINNLVATIDEVLKPVLDAVMLVLDLIMQILSPILDIIGGVLAMVVNLISQALQPVAEILQMVFGILSPLFEMLGGVVNMILAPLQSALSVLFNILQPLLSVALIPLQVTLQELQVPLKGLGILLGWLAPLFQIFGNIVTEIFRAVIKVINIVLSVIENAVNYVIGIINGLINGVNGALGLLGVHINRIAEVKLKIDTSSIDDIDDVNAIIDSNPPETPTDDTGGGTVYDGGGSSAFGDTYNYDNSVTNKTQNVTVTIQNYAAEVDVDEMVRQINIKLAEAM